MTTDAFPRLALPRFTPSATTWLTTRLALATAVAALADLLFYAVPGGPSNEPALAFTIFFGAVVLLSLIMNDIRAAMRTRMVLSFCYLAALLTVLDNLSVLSWLIAAVASLVFPLVMVTGTDRPWPRLLARALLLPFAGPFWMIGDVLRARRLAARYRRPIKIVATLVAWLVPLMFGAVFVALFASANPMIDVWVAWFDPRQLIALLAPGRIVFWCLIAVLVWPLIHLRIPRRRSAGQPARRPQTGDAITSDIDLLFGKAAVTRSLPLFNVLFAVQTLLDAIYLWGGHALPADMTYASYAHRGAYPLIATALLAAGFVLIALRDGGPVRDSRLIKPLILIFIAQNVALVVSSIQRTLNYVAVYSLSELRLAALIWMALVAFGLVLIVVRIVRDRSNGWLVNAAVAAGAITLVGCCYVNFPAVVANYNVAHSAELGGRGPALDLNYLVSLGPQAIPAYDDYFGRTGRKRPGADEQPQFATPGHLPGDDWRTWSFRGWRLQRYLDTHPVWAALNPAGDASTNRN